MKSRDLSNLMWTEALSLLEQADRLQRQFFRVGTTEAQVWEPPIDMAETADALIVQVARMGRVSIPVENPLIFCEAAPSRSTARMSPARRDCRASLGNPESRPMKSR